MLNNQQFTCLSHVSFWQSSIQHLQLISNASELVHIEEIENNFISGLARKKQIFSINTCASMIHLIAINQNETLPCFLDSTNARFKLYAKSWEGLIRFTEIFISVIFLLFVGFDVYKICTTMHQGSENA